MKDLRKLAYPAVAPSLLAADPRHMKAAVAEAVSAKVPYLHIDVMDGLFVPAVSFGLAFVEAIHATHPLINDTHLMIARPWEYAAAFAKAGSDLVTFHCEACPDRHKIDLAISSIKEASCRVGIALKPLTPTRVLLPYLGKVDLVLVMSVEPGQGGQPFLGESLARLSELRKMIDGLPLDRRPLLEVDGGLNELTGPSCVRAGADVLVAGSYLFGHPDFSDRVRRLLG
jgi:ribulose-phosphate 3-epimerase